MKILPRLNDLQTRVMRTALKHTIHELATFTAASIHFDLKDDISLQDLNQLLSWMEENSYLNSTHYYDRVKIENRYEIAKFYEYRINPEIIGYIRQLYETDNAI